MHRAISLCLILITVVIWAFYGSAWAVALLVICAAVLAADLLVYYRMRKTIEVKAAVDGVVRAKRADVLVTVLNGSMLPIPFFKGRIKVENTYTGEVSEKKFSVPIPPRGDNTVRISVETLHCGKHRVTAEKLILGDIFGLTGVPVSAAGQCNFTVLPEFFDTEVQYSLQERDDFDNDMYSPYRKGRDRSEVFQIREYEEGDSVNQIHWKLSSKVDKLIVKDPSQPISKSTAVIIDKSNPVSITGDTAESMAEIAISVGEALMREGLTFQLLWNDGKEKLIHTREIQFEDEFIESIPQFLTGQITAGAETFADLYQVLMGSLDASHIIYICPTERIIAEALCDCGRIVKLLADNPRYKDDYSMIQI